MPNIFIMNVYATKQTNPIGKKKRSFHFLINNLRSFHLMVSVAKKKGRKKLIPQYFF